MSHFEQEVDYNLSESGVHPLTLRDLLNYKPSILEELLGTELNYPYVNGDPTLRANIARIYSGAKEDNVLVTVGAIEANYISLRTLLNKGDELVVMLPNYMQIPGIAINHEYNLKTFSLKEENNWAPDLDLLEDLVTCKTKLIAICNPNNPTGYILTEQEMDAIVSIARKAGAWILADEVYSGAEHYTDQQTQSFYGRYPKVLAIGSMSKAYGLPGLRIGWIAGPQKTLDDIWARHEYVAISASMLSNKLAALALSEEVRPKLIKRTRDYIRKGFPLLREWMDNHPGMFQYVPPQAAAIAFTRYDLNINSTEFSNRLISEKSVFVVPGDFFGMDKFVRISYGLPDNYLLEALDRIHELILEIK